MEVKTGWVKPPNQIGGLDHLGFQALPPLVNISVGTKPVSIVLHEHAEALEFPIYYLNRDDSIL